MRKHNNTTKRLLALVVVLAMVMSLGFSAGAIDVSTLSGDGLPPSNDPYCSTYLNSSTGVTTDITVTLVIEAGDCYSWDYELSPGTAFYVEETRTLSYTNYHTNANGFVVKDLLDAVNANNTSNLSFTYTNSDYLRSVRHTGTDWTAKEWEATGPWYFDGWVFRVNDKFPVESIGANEYQGTAIDDTFLHDGDIVHFFYDAPSNFDDYIIPAARYMRATFESYDNSDLEVQLSTHTTWIDQHGGWIMNVYEYEDVEEAVNAYLYDATGTTYLGCATSDAYGVVVFENVSLTPGNKYIIKTNSTNYVFDDGYWEYIIGDTAYFDYTSAYSKITIPTT